MNRLPLRGLIAPLFIALAPAGGFLDLVLDLRSLGWLSFGALALGLAFARHTHRLFAGGLAAIRSGGATVRTVQMSQSGTLTGK
ncbi:MAG TPA: hypothetical protein VIH60_05710 [Steroidobacteraceae bacterium]|jgi:hypothetical protein